MRSSIHIHPRITKSWEQFLEEAPCDSLALDGYVAGPPRFDNARRVGNLNHHEGVDRLSTNCTSAQAFMVLKQRLLDIWHQPLQLFANDCDQDVCLSTWLLLNPDRVTGHSSEPLLNRLLAITNWMDVCAGAYPIKTDSRALETTLWIYDPYTAARRSGAVLTMDGPAMLSVIEAVHDRIHHYMLGEASSRKADTRYEIVHQGLMPLVNEIGAEARTEMLNQGVTQFIGYRGENNGKHHYSLIKLTAFAPISLEESYARLNRMENITGTDCWGGGNTCGGSPRNAGSELTPKQVWRALNYINEPRRK